MNDEIKEILDKIQKCKDYDDEVLLIKQYGATLLLDYITNLQQEIKEANDSITWWTNRFKAVERDNRELKQELEIMVKDDERNQETIIRLTKENERIEKEYKSKVDDIGKLTSRIYKAIEYIKTGKTFDNEVIRKVVDKIQNDLLNILQNGSEENERDL